MEECAKTRLPVRCWAGLQGAPHRGIGDTQSLTRDDDGGFDMRQGKAAAGEITQHSLLEVLILQELNVKTAGRPVLHPQNLTLSLTGSC